MFGEAIRGSRPAVRGFHPRLAVISANGEGGTAVTMKIGSINLFAGVRARAHGGHDGHRVPPSRQA